MQGLYSSPSLPSHVGSRGLAHHGTSLGRGPPASLLLESPAPTLTVLFRRLLLPEEIKVPVLWVCDLLSATPFFFFFLIFYFIFIYFFLFFPFIFIS